jgi:hypothetical protein
MTFRSVGGRIGFAASDEPTRPRGQTSDSEGGYSAQMASRLVPTDCAERFARAVKGAVDAQQLLVTSCFGSSVRRDSNCNPGLELSIRPLANATSRVLLTSVSGTRGLFGQIRRLAPIART